MPCHGCDKIYVGETSLKLKDRIYQHRYALKTNNLNNALVTHRENTSHAIDLNGAKIIRNQTDQRKRRIIEAATISQMKTMKQRPGFYNISPHISELVLNLRRIEFKVNHVTFNISLVYTNFYKKFLSPFPFTFYSTLLCLFCITQ